MNATNNMVSGFKRGAIVAVVLLTAALAGCNKGGGDSNNNSNGTSGGTVVQAIPDNVDVLPTSNQCLNTNINYTSANWGPYQQAGFVQPNGYYGNMRFGHRRGYSRSASACPAGTYPACDAQVGLVCVQEQCMNNMTLAWYGYNGTQFNFCGYNQYQGYSTGFGSTCGLGSTGYAPVGQTCVVGTNSCAYGRCAPVSYNSSIGICVQ